MTAILLGALMTVVAHADDFSSRLNRIGEIHERANGLLRQAGVLEEERNENGTEGKPGGRFLKVHDLSQSRQVSEGALLFGRSVFRLIVGSESSPVQVRLKSSEQFPWTEGLLVTGSATQSGGRIFVEFNRLLLRSGKAISIQGVALDPAGSLGLKGEKENPKLLEVAGGTALGLLTAPDDTPDVLGFGSVIRKSSKDRLRESLLGETKNYIKDELKENPVLRLDMDTPITVLVKEEVRL